MDDARPWLLLSCATQHKGHVVLGKIVIWEAPDFVSELRLLYDMTCTTENECSHAQINRGVSSSP